uniref:G protein subunit alpha 12 n=1 Tax=Cyprinus carpio TaxID=7962 RepID=A0A8C1MN39_CYPCA
MRGEIYRNMSLYKLSQCFLPDTSDARRRSREIDAMLKRDRRMPPVVITLEGSDRGGISTFLKQMRLINGKEYNHKEVLEFREVIYDNIIQGMGVLVQERKKLGIPLHNSTNEMHEMLFESLDWRVTLEPCTFQPYVEAIDSLWKDSGIQEAHRRRSNFKLYESVKYFFNNIHRIGQLNYLPYNQDILYACKVRENLGDHYFELRDSPFTVIKGSVMRYILPKLGKYLDIDTPIFYIIGSSDYDKIFCGDNCLIQSMNTFECLCNSKGLLNCPIILLFNKMDLLAEKIQTSDIRKHFPEFQGDPHRQEDVQEFLVQSFQKRKGNNSRNIFYHMTTAVDTENVRKVFESIKVDIITCILKDSQLL